MSVAAFPQCALLSSGNRPILHLPQRDPNDKNSRGTKETSDDDDDDHICAHRKPAKQQQLTGRHEQPNIHNYRAQPMTTLEPLLSQDFALHIRTERPADAACWSDPITKWHMDRSTTDEFIDNKEREKEGQRKGLRKRRQAPTAYCSLSVQ